MALHLGAALVLQGSQLRITYRGIAKLHSRDPTTQQRSQTTGQCIVQHAMHTSTRPKPYG